MHDPKFEKEVQQKLEELSFSPSEAVWTRVERAVNGDKKRRVPIFWFFLLPALTLTGAGVIYFSHTRTTPAVVQRTAAPANPQTLSGKTAATRVDALPSTPGSSVSRPAVAAPLVGQDASITTSPVTKPSATTPSITTPLVKAPSVAGARPATVSTVNTNTSAHRTDLSSNRTIARTPAAIRSSGTSGTLPFHDVHTESPDVHTESPAVADAEHAFLPGLMAFDRHFHAPAASSLSSRSQALTAAKAPIQLKPKYAWEAGFAGGIGASSLNKTLFQQPVITSGLAPNAAPINGVPKSYTSQIRPDLSYWAGIVAQRPLNSRLTLSLGLDLHYYSAKIQVGEKVVNAPSQNNSGQSLFTAQNQAQAAAYPYYSVGDKDVFTNRYYFLELPASVLWQVNHSRNLPLFWETGFSFAYLMSSSALYYNAKSSVFYKDGGMINKTQLNLATALLVGLPIKGMRLQAGPQIQYGITTLQNQGSSGQHLFYGGLRLILLPGKIKK